MSPEELGLDRRITRRDFAYLAGIGAAGATRSCGGESAAPGGAGSAPDAWSDSLGSDWYGPGGVGDYAASHGNTPDVVRVAHGLRVDRYAAGVETATDTGERFDVVVVGGGISGLSAAHHFKRLHPGGRCLVIDNHPVFGGEAKRNEFDVDGVRLIGPQGSNGFGVRPTTGDPDDYFTSLGIPTEFEYAPWDDDVRVPYDHYGFMHWMQERFSVGHFFGGTDGGTWIHDLWGDGLERAPMTDEERTGFRNWRAARLDEHTPPGAVGQDPPRWLDGMTLRAYYEDVLGLPRRVTRYVDPILASIIGLGCDAISAWWGLHFALPGYGLESRYDGVTFHCFPGGNAGIARYFVKDLVPEGIAGERDLTGVIGGAIDFAALDRPDRPVRIRLGCTVVDVRRAGPTGRDGVRVTYSDGERLHSVRAARAVMASGAWANRHVLHDLPDTHRTAYESFVHAPILAVNVALRNWRFMHRLGVSACMYEGDFGFSCNIRRPMYTDTYRPSFGPDEPTVLTFYKTFEQPGLPPVEQGVRGRTELLSTPFGEYERRVRAQMVTLFGDAGFDPTRDIAGIVLNRWGHAYVAPGPGFFFGDGARPAPPDIIREPFGGVAIGHSELRGHQNWTGAAAEGRRAVETVLDTL